MNRNLRSLIVLFLAVNSTIRVNAQNGIKSMFIPEIILMGNNEEIPDGDTIPVTKNNTHFGNVRLASSQTQEFFIINSGPSTLVVSDINFTGQNAAEYTLTEIPAFPINIESGNNFSIHVIFTPKKGGTRSCTMNIINNDLDEGLYDVRLEAEATFATSLEYLGSAVSGLSVYPNPARDIATIEITSTDPKAADMHIYDVQGKEVQPGLTTGFFNGTQRVEIATSDLDNGIYYVSLHSSEGQKNTKIVVAH